MKTTNSLVVEMVTLRQAVKAHRDLLTEAQWQRTLAMEAAGVPTLYGRYDLDSKDEWRYPSVAEASRQVETLSEDSGYFWACSRLTDLERLLGDGMNSQLPLRLEESNYVPLFGGDIPEAHPVVSQFLRAA